MRKSQKKVRTFILAFSVIVFLSRKEKIGIVMDENEHWVRYFDEHGYEYF